MTGTRLLIVDDDVETTEVLKLFFEHEGWLCTVAHTAVAALDALRHIEVDAVVSDIRMGEMDGLELLDRLTKAYPSLPVVLMTGKSAIPEAVDAMKRGAYDYLTKPCDIDELRSIVIRALDDYRVRVSSVESSRRVRSLPPVEEVTAVVGDSAAMRALRDAVEHVAASSAPVLLMGETGAGKELVARAIHAKGDRRARRFVPVNTSAIPSELLEGEIFGHLRGAFTGAVQARKGLLAEADGGTLLLDEIRGHAAPPSGQAPARPSVRRRAAGRERPLPQRRRAFHRGNAPRLAGADS